MQAVLGVDMGTTNIKAVVFGLDGSVLGLGRMELQDISPSSGASEHSLDELWNAFALTVKTAVQYSGVSPEHIGGIGFSTYLGGFTALDTDGQPIIPNMLTWKDKRALKHKDKVFEGITEDEYRRRIGQRWTGSQAVPRFHWLKEHAGVDADRVGNLILCAKQYAVYRLLGTHHLDWECARSTGLFNMETRQWQRDQFETWGIRESMLPRLWKCHDVIGQVPAETARFLGLAPGTPVVIGGGDGLMSSVGCGVIQPGIAAASIGTVAVVRGFRREYVHVKNPIVDCKILPDVGFLNSAIALTGGLALKWFRDKLGRLETVVAEESGIDAFVLVDQMASQASPGCDGLLYVPPKPGDVAFDGSGHPVGSFIGVTERHGRKEFARAIMEGIAYILRTELRMLLEEGYEPFELMRFGGGGARSPLWCQIVADTTRLPVETVATEETGALGAAIMAAWGVGAFGSLQDAVESMVHVVRHYDPEPTSARIYEMACARRETLAL
ncbi:MAG: FGGY family carbohydrate kinase [Firmicutes bacterium]|jgi:xylulokinase|nr:FGGY family carbohydrate kinase [Bacillota bacterium]